jgi:hypothetical protein
MPKFFFVSFQSMQEKMKIKSTGFEQRGVRKVPESVTYYLNGP